LTNTFKVDMEVKNVVLEPVSDILWVSQIETSNNSINLVSIILWLIYLCFRFAFLWLLFLFFKYIFSFLKYISHLLFWDNLHWNDWNVISLIVYIVFIIALFIFFGTLFSYVLDLSSFTTEILNLWNTIFSLFAVSFWNYDFYYNFVNTFTTGIYGLILLYIVYLITNKYWRLN
jgi:hypothetical protein